MSTMIDIQGGLEAWARHLMAFDAGDVLEPIAKKTALQVKTRMRDDARGHPHAPRLPFRVNYDIDKGPRSINARIGPEKGGQGSLALYWLGNARLRPVLPDPIRYLEAEVAKGAEFAVNQIERKIGGG